MTKLVFIGAEGAPEVPIPPTGVTFGRAPDCDLPIQEGSVSGHHGSLRFEGGRDRLRWALDDAFGASVGCAVVLPKGAEVLEADAWTQQGLVGRAKAVVEDGAAPSARIFVSRGPVPKDHAFVCEMAWAKGAVAPDEGARRLAWYDRALWLACGIELALCLALWFLFGRDPSHAPVPPLFRPRRTDRAACSRPRPQTSLPRAAG